MIGFIVRTLITMLGLYLASRFVSGVMISGTFSFVMASLLLGFVNAFVRPLVIILTLPLNILTLGLFTFVINAGMFGLVAAFLDRFSVDNFWAAFFGAIIVSITSTIASWCIGPDGRYEVIVRRR